MIENNFFLENKKKLLINLVNTCPSLKQWYYGKGSSLSSNIFHPSEPDFGMKIFQLREDNGYAYRFEVYTGQNMNEDTEWPKTEHPVKRMFLPLQNKGYELYMDNWYTTPHLLKNLHKNQTNAFGTGLKM